MTGPPTYYGRPALKPSDWRWLIVTYLFIGGMAGAAQVIATVVDLLGSPRDRALVRGGRYLALLGALVSPILLILDLHTPSRWYNMLRIYRGTSPMSIGSWTLAAFGTFTGLAALGHLLADVLGWRSGRQLARLAGPPAAASGALLSVYTGSLLAATSTPLWAHSYRLLPPMFGVSGTATATAALSLLLDRADAPPDSRRRLERLGLLTSALELGLFVALDRDWRRAGLAAPLETRRLGVVYKLGVLGVGVLTPLGVHVVQLLSHRQLANLGRLAAVATLVGGYAQRAVIVLAGKSSAERPEDYFRLAR